MTAYWIPAVARLAAGAKVTEQVDAFFHGWWECEGGNNGPMRNIWPSAHFNWLCTKQRMPGSTAFNDVGVQNYPLWLTGVTATAITLRKPFYAGLRAALRSGRPLAPVHHVPIISSLSFWSHGQVCPKGLAYGERVLEIAGAWL